MHVVMNCEVIVSSNDDNYDETGKLEQLETLLSCASDAMNEHIYMYMTEYENLEKFKVHIKEIK